MARTGRARLGSVKRSGGFVVKPASTSRRGRAGLGMAGRGSVRQALARQGTVWRGVPRGSSAKPLSNGRKVHQNTKGGLHTDIQNRGGGVALFLSMGVGKTVVAIAVTGRMFLDGHIKRVLVVAPSSVCPVWPAEYEKFAGFPVRVALLLGDRDKRIKALQRLECASIGGALRIAVINYESVWRLEDELLGFVPGHDRL